MEEKKSYPSKQQKKSRQTFLGTLFKILFMLILLSIVSWVFLVAWFSVKVIFSTDYSVTSNLQLISENQLNFIDYNHQGYLQIFLEYFKHGRRVVNSALGYVMSSNAGENITEIILGTAEIIAIRSCIFLTSLPFLVITLFVFVVDGFVQRDIKKFRGERESTLFFHSLKPLIGISFFSLFLLFMAMPLVVEPQFILIPMAFVTGIFAMLSIKSFKKYM